MNKKVSILKRKVKYARLEVDLEGLKIIVPENFQISTDEIFQKHRKWIRQKIERLEEIKKISETLELYNHENLKEMVNSFIEDIGKILKIKPERVVFRKMKVRWGSCHHEKKIIILNKSLKFLPKELIRYVVLHEMCHLIFRNHKNYFWLLIKKIDPNFKEKEKLLAGYRLKLNCYFNPINYAKGKTIIGESKQKVED